MVTADIFAELGLPRPINAAGYLTVNGAAPVDPEVVDAVAAILPHTVVMSSLQDVASKAIAESTGAEAGCVTACAAAGIAVSVAAAMTGGDPRRVAQLPDTTGLRSQVLLPRGHDCDFGAVVSQMIRISGAQPVFVGSPDACTAADVSNAITDETAAAVYVTSNHIDAACALSLQDYAAILRPIGIPIIADCAAEDDLVGFLQAGADIALYSAHKVRRGPTAGIIAGRADLIGACRAQEHGIGRPMKVGKEGVVGVIAALGRWQSRDHQAVAQSWLARIELALETLSGTKAIEATLEQDPNGNPVPRALITLTADSRVTTAAALINQLATADPPYLLRPTENDPRSLLLDPRSLGDDEMLQVCERIRDACGDGQ